MFHEIRLMMEKNPFLRKLVPVILETKLMQYKSQIVRSRRYDREKLQRDQNVMAEFKACYEAHKEEFEQVAGLLEDDFSRLTLHTVIEYRLFPCKKTLKPIFTAPQYFPRDIIKKQKDMVFIDGGGYTGDTLVSLATFWGKNSWKKIYTWEPDTINRAELIKRCELHNFQNVEILPFRLWSKKAQLHFNMQGKDWSRFSENAAFIVEANSIDNLCSNEKVTFIKMDIEGSELEALKGAEKVIRRDRPILAISIYHKPTDYFEIPLYIKKLVPEYKLYIRHHKFNKDDTVLYATF